MTDNSDIRKKRAPTAATADARADKATTTHEAAHCTPILPKQRRKGNPSLLDYIPAGRKNAMPVRQLAKLAGYRDARSLTQDIHALRIQGYIILFAPERPAGHFLPKRPSEVGRFVRQMKSRIAEIQRAVRAAERYARQHNNDE